MLNLRIFSVVLPILFIFVFTYKVNAQSFPDGLIGLSTSEPAVLYTLDTSTGKATPILTLNREASLVGLAYLNQILYGSDLCLDPQCNDYFIGLIFTSGTTAFLSNQNGSSDWLGLAADEANRIIYSIDYDNSDILTAQFPDGSVETIGSGVGFDAPGLDYDDTHRILYAVSADWSLYTISTATGTASLIGPTGIPGQTGDLEIGLAYDECNQILYVNAGQLGQLYTLDINTGTATLVGSNGVEDDIDGLAWKGSCGPNPIPTLSEWGMMSAAAGLGLIGVFFALKRRKAQVGV